MDKKALLAMGVAGILTYCVPCSSVKALSTENDNQQSYSDEVQPRTAGLLRTCDIHVSENNGCLCIDSSTTSNNQMYCIGLKDIDIERSSDNEHWSKEKSISDMLSYSASSKHINGHSVSVQGGYYYRITCKHYAKESLFGNSQSVSNTSNSVWIP